MEAKRLGNLDIIAHINEDEISRIESASEGEMIASSKIKSFDDKVLQLIYVNKRNTYSDRGIDCSDIIKYIADGIIPVYITRSDIAQRLREGDYCGSAFLQYRFELKAKE